MIILKNEVLLKRGMIFVMIRMAVTNEIFLGSVSNLLVKIGKIEHSRGYRVRVAKKQRISITRKE